MIAIAFVMFSGLVVAVAIGLAVLRSATLDRETTKARFHAPGAQTLVYDVPSGQDSVPMILALSYAGFPCVEEYTSGTRHLVVDCPRGRLEDRSHVRSTIAEAADPQLVVGADRLASVRFADEI